MCLHQFACIVLALIVGTLVFPHNAFAQDSGPEVFSLDYLLESKAFLDGEMEDSVFTEWIGMMVGQLEGFVHGYADAFQGSYPEGELASVSKDWLSLLDSLPDLKSKLDSSGYTHLVANKVVTGLAKLISLEAEQGSVESFEMTIEKAKQLGPHLINLRDSVLVELLVLSAQSMNHSFSGNIEKAVQYQYWAQRTIGSEAWRRVSASLPNTGSGGGIEHIIENSFHLPPAPSASTYTPFPNTQRQTVLANRLSSPIKRVGDLKVFLASSNTRMAKFFHYSILKLESSYLLLQEKPEQALQAHLKAVEVNPSKSTNWNTARDLKYIGSLFLDQFYKSPDSTIFLRKALENTELAYKAVSELQMKEFQETGVLEFQPLRNEVVELYLECLLDQFEVNRDPIFIKKASHLVEESQALGLQLKMALSQDNFLVRMGDQGEEVLETERELELYRFKLANTWGNEMSWKERSELERLEFKLDQMYEELGVEQSTTTFEFNIPSLDELQKGLETDEALINYFITPYRSYTFVVTADTCHLEFLRLESNAETEINSFLQAVQTNDLKQIARKGFLLYSIYFRPIRHIVEGKRLRIARGDFLHRVPFQALQTKLRLRDLPEKAFHQLPYLLHDFEISYIPSFSHYFNSVQARRGSTDSNTVSMMALAPGTAALADGSDRPQTWNVDLSRSIAQATQGTSLVNAEATEENLWAQIHNHKALFIASHGYASEKNPYLSHLVLAEPTGKGNAPQNDGKLHFWELYHQQFDLELAILNACNTGVGKVVQGEGVLSIPRGFLIAGTQTVVHTAWEVEENHARHLLHDFIARLQTGESRAAALRSAQLAHLEQNTQLAAAPSVWAPFELTGNPGPMLLAKANEPGWPWSLMVLAAVLTVLPFLIYFSKKQ